MIVSKLLQGGRSDALTVGDLSVVLNHIRRLFDSAGAKSAVKDLEALSRVLAPHANMSVAAFCADAETRIQQTQRTKSRKKAPVSVGAVESNSEAIREYVTQLRDAGTDQQAFDAAFERLRGDKAIKSPYVGEIARQYSLSATKYKSIKAAHADIKRTFLRQARFENKVR
jgi:hypothetical protein